MKLIIDIPDHLYSVIKNKECTHNNVLTEAVDNGTPIPDNATVCDIQKVRNAFSTGVECVEEEAAKLEQIRAEVEKWAKDPCVIEHGCGDEVLQIIDKVYKV